MHYGLLSGIMLIVLMAGFCLPESAVAKTEWEMLKSVPLDAQPLDITLSTDGTTAYILSEKNIMIFSTRQNKVTDTIPLKEAFSKIALSPDGNRLFLTGSQSKQLSIVKISQIYDMQIDKSPVIGSPNAKVNVVAFVDYQ